MPLSDRRKMTFIMSVIYEQNSHNTIKICWKSVRRILRDFVWKVYFNRKKLRVYNFHLRKLPCYWTKFTNFTHDVAKSSQMNFLKAEWRYCNPFWNVRATHKAEQFNLVNFGPKIGCHGNVLWAIRKRGQIGNLRSNTYHMVKICWKSV